MRALCIHSHDGPASIQVNEIAVVAPGPGEVRIRVAAAGMNNSDLQTTYGTYGGMTSADFPYGFGQEAAGEVEAVGTGVSQFSPGMRVFGRVRGAFAETAVGAAAELLELPQEISFEVAASLPIAYLTASLALVHKAKVQKDDWVLVHPGSGGVGSATIQLAKVLGARAIATTGSKEKVSYLSSLGADEVLIYTQDSVAEAVKQITHGRGVQVAIDGGGQVTLPQCLKAVANEGRVVSYGYTTGLMAPLPLGKLIGQNVTLFGIALWYNLDYSAAWETLRNLVIPGIMSGEFKPLIHQVNGLTGVAEALIQLQQHSINGKFVVVPSF